VNRARFVGVVCILASLAWVPPALARRSTVVPASRTHAGKPHGARAGKTRFFDFDDLLIDGEFRKPAALYTRAMRSPRFDRLLRLQKSFLDTLVQSLRDPGLQWYH